VALRIAFFAVGVHTPALQLMFLVAADEICTDACALPASRPRSAKPAEPEIALIDASPPVAFAEHTPFCGRNDR